MSNVGLLLEAKELVGEVLLQPGQEAEPGLLCPDLPVLYPEASGCSVSLSKVIHADKF